MFFFLFLLGLAIHVYFGVHAYNHGNSQWLFFIIFAPLVGCLMYFFVEIFPEFEWGVPVNQELHKRERIRVPNKRKLQKLKANLVHENSLKNREALADEFLSQNVYDKAIDLYQSCMEEEYPENPHLALTLAFAYFSSQSFKKAKEILGRLQEDHPTFKTLDVELYHTRMAEHLGQDEEALNGYQTLLSQIPGEEVPCRYALLLMKVGKEKEAQKLYQEVMQRYKKGDKQYREEQKEWKNTLEQYFGF